MIEEVKAIYLAQLGSQIAYYANPAVNKVFHKMIDFSRRHHDKYKSNGCYSQSIVNMMVYEYDRRS